MTVQSLIEGGKPELEVIFNDNTFHKFEYLSEQDRDNAFETITRAIDEASKDAFKIGNGDGYDHGWEVGFDEGQGVLHSDYTKRFVAGVLIGVGVTIFGMWLYKKYKASQYDNDKE